MRLAGWRSRTSGGTQQRLVSLALNQRAAEASVSLLVEIPVAP
jgi:hypothetical protein